MRDIFQEINQTIAASDVVLFMKGTAKQPLCGFSSVVARILDSMQVPFTDVDVLKDPEIREGIKEFTNWPTIPQLYIKGEFIGGADIVKELYESGELKVLLGKDTTEQE